MILWGCIKQQSASTLWWTYFFGVLWGFGGLTFGLTMRYLGMSLGMGVALGYCAAFGTLVPPMFKAIMPGLPVGASIIEIAKSTSGQVTLAGVGVCLVGIGIAALAGLTKEREMPEEQKKLVIKEFNFKKGIMVATFSRHDERLFCVCPCRRARASMTPRWPPARLKSGPACRPWSCCCWVDLRRISSGACC